jgi:7-cyano-7-deazaguanine synthase
MADQPMAKSRHGLREQVVDRVAVLTSGGLDSAVLVADLARNADVFPLYVEFGLAWEAPEQEALRTYLAALGGRRFAPLATLAVPVDRVYGRHWSLTGEDVPDYDAKIDADYLPGRNILLLGVAGVWCALHDVHRIALGSLMQNPYPDATPEFFTDYGRLLSGALRHAIEVVAPYRGMKKSELIRANRELPLHLTLTCIGQKAGANLHQRGPLHCGACLKCHERHEAFVEAGVSDRTRYAVTPA